MVTRHSREDALDEDQYERLFTAAQSLKSPYDVECTFVVVAGGRLGMRAGEIAHIHEDWLDEGRKLINIPRYHECTKGKYGGVCGYCKKQARQHVECVDGVTYDEALEERWNPKTENSARSIPYDWDDRVEAVVEAFFDVNEEYSHSRVSVNRRVTRAAEAAGFDSKRVYPHSLRATASTFLSYEGVPAPALQSLFGWSDISTAQKYLRVSGGATKKAMNNVFSE